MSESTKNFPVAFWTANSVELFERAAYYAVFIAITLYLTDLVGFNDIQAAWISGMFSAGLYFLPAFAGAFADKIGFRSALLLAFSLLTIGYFFLGLFPYKLLVIPSLLLIMIGGAFIKSIITGTVAKTTSESNRARGYSIFYAIVNVGSFSGKTFAFPLRVNLGVEYINFFSAGCTFIALLVVFFLYKNVDAKKNTELAAVWRSLLKVLSNGKLVMLIIIVTGFWMIQQQLYATMPKYVIRMVGKSAAPEWIANVNPMVVVLAVMTITKMMKKRSALSSMTIGMFLMPLSAVAMALGPILQSVGGNSISVLGLFNAHPVNIMLIAGIMIQALAECFISPRYLEFFSLQAPKGEEGLYLGFSHLYSFLASILGFGLSGFLLSAYCPDPNTLTPQQLVHAYDNAHLIWYYFAGIGSVAALALVIYGRVNRQK